MTRRVRGVIRLFLELDGFFLAAGLSFAVVVCIVPFVLVLIAGGGFLLSDERVVREVLDRLTSSLPVYHSEMKQLLMGVVEARGVSGVVGTVALLLFATQLFAATRLVLNRIFGLRGRRFLHGMLFDLGMILLLLLLFFVTVGATATLAWVRRLLMVFERGILVASLFEWAAILLAVGLDTALFVVLYRFVPNTRLPWPSVLVGSGATAVLWELAKQLFRHYIERVGVYSMLYGSLGVTIALIMWVYYSAVVFVLGAALIRRLEESRSAGPAV